jgi:hypothetical protein
MKSTLILLTCVMALAVTSCKKTVKVPPTTQTGQDSTDTLTQLQIINATDTPVVVWITLGATPGCLQNIKQIPFITDSTAPLQGWFTLGANDSTPVYAPAGMGFNGNISFNTPPLNCPTPTFTQGVNIFEFIINNSFQGANSQETIEISCVAGVNCFIKSYLSGGNPWNASDSFPDVDSMYNAGINDNSGLVGVFPYGCDVCTGASKPPACTPPTNDSDKQTLPICTVQRNAVGAGGGLIQVLYLGSN